MGDFHETKFQKLRELNSCYEALLDLRCIFPSWSEFKDNFFFHWKQVMGYRDNGTLPFYLETLEPLITSKGTLPTEKALTLVSKIDKHREQCQNTFTCENLQKLLEKDAKITTDSQKIPNLQIPHLDKLNNIISKDIKRKRPDHTGKTDRDHDEASSFPSRKGVYYDKGRMLWRAYWKQDGRVITKGFSLAEFKTHEEARRNAIICREMKERELGITI